MREPRPDRVYCQFTMDFKDAVRELNSAGKVSAAAWAASKKIADLLFEIGLTPLQAQAVLVRAWQKVQMDGRLSSRQESQDQGPSRREAQFPPTE